MATWKWYGKGLQHVANGDVDFLADTIKVLLTTSAYTPDQDVHDFRDDVTDEVTGTLYVAGGATLAGKSIDYDAANNRVRLKATDPAWGPGATITARRAVAYKARGGASSADELLGFIDFGGDQAVSDGTLTLDFDATEGFLRLAAAA